MRLVSPVLADPATGTGQAVVLFPHAGGSPRFFRHLAEALPRNRVLGVTYPGRDHLVEQTPATDVAELATAVADELTGLSPVREGPLVLVGHSLGAFVAYECAVALRRSAAAPQAVVVVSGQNPPTARRDDDRRWTQESSDDELVADVVRQNPASAAVWQNAELRAFFLPTVRADYRLLSGYRPSGGRVAEVRVVVGADDQEVDLARLDEWQQLAERRTGLTVLDGGHFYLERPDTQLARVLDEMTAPVGRTR